MFFNIFLFCLKGYSETLKCGIFPNDWKKGNIVPIGDKQNIKAIVQSLFFQSVARFLNVSYTMTC